MGSGRMLRIGIMLSLRRIGQKSQRQTASQLWPQATIFRLGRLTLLTLAFISGACSASTGSVPNETRLPDLKLSSGQDLKEVYLHHNEAEGSVNLLFKTTTRLSDCRSLHAEVREAWSKILHTEADNRAAKVASLIPEDPSGSGEGFTYRKQDGSWREWNCGRCESDSSHRAS